MVVTGLTRNQLYRFRYRGFESHRLRHIKAVCLYTNKKTRENLSPFFVLLLGNCLASFTAGQSEIVTLAFSAPLARYSVASLLTNPTVSASKNLNRTLGLGSFFYSFSFFYQCILNAAKAKLIFYKQLYLILRL